MSVSYSRTYTPISLWVYAYMCDLKFQNLYKADLQWLRGIGWIPSGSLEDEKNKRATQILSDHVYRQHPDKFKFSSLMDSMPMVLAKNNAITMNHVSPFFA